MLATQGKIQGKFYEEDDWNENIEFTIQNLPARNNKGY